MEDRFCQSCGMPLKSNADLGTEVDGKKNIDYCKYCYIDGKFTENFTMEEMIMHCAGFVEEFNKDSDVKFTRKQAIEQMKQYFPMLKRWKK